MLDAGEPFHDFFDGLIRNAEDFGDGHSDHHVLQVVFARQADGGQRQDRLIAHAKLTVFHVVVRVGVVEAEGFHGGRDRVLLDVLGEDRVVGVQDERVLRLHVAVHFGLRLVVGFEGTHEVHVVGRQVDDGGDVRTETVDVDELVVGDLEGDVVVALLHEALFHDDLTQRDADVAAQVGFAGEGRVQDLVDEGSRGGLSVRAGNGDVMLWLRDLEGQFDLGDDRDAVLRQRLHEGAAVGDTGVLDTEVVMLIEDLHALVDDGDAQFLQRGELLEFLRGLALREDDVRPQLVKDFDGCHAAAGEADD